jgi:hypothetical protein
MSTRSQAIWPHAQALRKLKARVRGGSTEAEVNRETTTDLQRANLVRRIKGWDVAKSVVRIEQRLTQGDKNNDANNRRKE